MENFKENDRTIIKNTWAIIGNYFCLTFMLFPILFGILGIPQRFPQYDLEIIQISAIIGPFFGLIFAIKGYINHKKDPYISFKPVRDAIICNLFFMIIAPFMIGAFYAGHTADKARQDFTLCKKNLETIGKSIEEYKKDTGSYPPSLKYLTENKDNKSYMNHIPSCPAYGVAYGYEASSHNFTLWCNEKINHHRTGSVPEDGAWPQYNPGKGVLVK